MDDKKGRRVASPIYDSKIEAENMIYNFRKSRESNRAKRRLDSWEATLGTEKEATWGAEDKKRTNANATKSICHLHSSQAAC